MTTSTKVLLVEGDADKYFFEKICKKLSLDTEVQVAPPKELGGGRNSKEGVFQRLEFFLKQLAQGNITHIALVVDADYLEYHGLGCQKTIDRVTAIVEPFDFELDQDKSNGLCFKHSNGFADLGLWVKACVKEDEQALLNQSIVAIQAIDNPKFKSHLTAKAEVATWLAWQKQPGHGLYVAIRDELLDHESPLFSRMEQWLLRIFT